MKTNFFNRIYRAIKIDPELYEEVEHDKSATLQAALVVILSSLAAGVGAIHLGASNFIFGPIISLASWYFWAFLIYIVGTKLFPDKQTKSNHGEVLRTIGFSSAPGLIRIFGFTPELMTVTQALDYKSLWKAFGVVILCWFFQAIILFVILLIFR